MARKLRLRAQQAVSLAVVRELCRRSWSPETWTTCERDAGKVGLRTWQVCETLEAQAALVIEFQLAKRIPWEWKFFFFREGKGEFPVVGEEMKRIYGTNRRAEDQRRGWRTLLLRRMATGNMNTHWGS